MSDARPQTILENLSELFHTIDSSGHELVTPTELEGFLYSEKSRRLSLRQHKTLAKTVQKMSPNEYMDVEEFENVLTSPSTYDTLWKKTMVIIGDLTTPTSRKLEVRTYLDAHSCCPPAVFLILISLLQIFIFLKFDSKNVKTMLSFKGPLRYEVYRYITYIFVHNNVTHLTGNIIVQLSCIPCEIVDHWRVWIIYIVGAIFGSATYYIVCPSGELIGASASVFSLLAINIAELVMNWKEMPIRYFRLVFYGSYIVMHFTMVAWSFTHPGQDGYKAVVSECAHFAGLLCGILLGLILVKNLIIEHHEIVIRSFCILLFTLVCGALLGLNCYNLYALN